MTGQPAVRQFVRLAYVLGNVLISIIAAAGTFVWLTAFDVPYSLLLGIFVGLFDLIPIVGSTIAGAAVAAVALTVSVPICVATIISFITFRLAEDSRVGKQVEKR